MSIIVKLDYAPEASYWLKKDQWIASIFDGEIARTGDYPGEALEFIGGVIEEQYPQLLTDLKKEASK